MKLLKKYVNDICTVLIRRAKASNVMIFCSLIVYGIMMNTYSSAFKFLLIKLLQHVYWITRHKYCYSPSHFHHTYI